MRSFTRPNGLSIAIVLASVWAGSLVSYIILVNIQKTAEVRADSGDAQTDAARRRLFRRDKEEKRTIPYDEKTAPELKDGEVAPPAAEGEDFQFATPNSPLDEADALLAEIPAEPAGEITGILDAIKKLINGEGGFQDIIKIGIAAFALFGGSKMGSSDMLFKVILGLFSKKANYNAILKDEVKRTGVLGRRRRSG